MAGHLELQKENEPKIFSTLEELKERVLLVGKLAKDFQEWEIDFNSEKNKYKVMKLSLDYVENKRTERAFTIGPFSPKTVEDQDDSIAKDIALEVHYETINGKIKVKRVYWVA